MKEIWKPVVGWEGWYKVSNKGRVKRIKLGRGRLKPRILDGHLNNKGYIRVILTRNNKTKDLYAHRLVAQAFISNPDNKPEVNHKDGQRTFNWPSNLEWMTRLENVRHGINTLKTQITGEKHPNSKLKNKDILEIRGIISLGCYSLTEIGQMFGVSGKNIHAIKAGKTWRHIK